MVAVEKLLKYENFVGYLRDVLGYREVEPGVFVLKEDEYEPELLIVRRGDKYREVVSSIRKEIMEHSYVVEDKIGIKEYGIAFVDNKYVIFVRRIMEGIEPKPQVLRKSLDRITPQFKKKFREWLKDISNWENWEILFDRSDVIEEFHLLFSKARENLLKSVNGINDDEEREEFADTLMMQLLIIWYLQEKGFLAGDQKYLINMFKNYKKYGFRSFYEFLQCLFEKMSGIRINGNSQCESINLGDIIVTGPAPFLESIGKYDGVEIPDGVFYKEGQTEILKKKDPKKISDPKEVPILNLFESRDWTEEGEIDNFVLGAIFEKLMTKDVRKGTGAFYTPKIITEYIARETIDPYLIDKINEEFKTNYKSLSEFFESCNKLAQKGENAQCEKKLKFLFDRLQDIRILDPACGSGHFLERAVEVLADIYLNIKRLVELYNMNRELFNIEVSDEEGNIKRVDILSIQDEEEFKMKIKFHIIVSRNIYGVDINRRAIEIARARLFLSIAEHFERSSSPVGNNSYIRFPNVYFNLRSGNSLIGFLDLSPFEEAEAKSQRQKQVSLDAFFKRNSSKIKEVEKKRRTKIGYLGFYKSIKEDPALRTYLRNMDEKLKTNVLPLAEEIVRYHDKPLSKNAVLNILRFKSELNKILLVSLNSEMALKIAELIKDINRSFDEYLTEEFAKYLSNISKQKIQLSKDVLKNPITERELKEGKKIGHFHWILEFPEVFFEFKNRETTKKRGFDIIIGNPPYGRIKQIIEDKNMKQLLSNIYKTLYKYQVGNFNLYKLFLERSYCLLRDKGYFGMIFPSSFLGENDSKNLRKLFFEKNEVRKILEFPEKTQVFKGITQAVCILIYRKKPKEDYSIRIKTGISRAEKSNLFSLEFLEIKKSELIQLTGKEYRIPLFTDPKVEWEILKHISRCPSFKGDENNPPVGDMGVGHLDETFNKEFMSDEPGDDLLIKGHHISRFFVDLDPNSERKPRWIIKKNEFLKRKPTASEIFNKDLIVWKRSVNRAAKRRLQFGFVKGEYILTNTVCYLVPSAEYHWGYLLAVLNSTLMEWRFRLTSFNNDIRIYQVEEFPLPRIPADEQYPFVIFSKYLIFLRQYQNYFARDDSQIQYMIEFFDNLLDCLVYDLYLGKQIKVPIRHIVENKLKDIESKLGGSDIDSSVNLVNLLTVPETVREELLSKIKNVFQELENDDWLNDNLYVLKRHPWIKTIQQSLGGK